MIVRFVGEIISHNAEAQAVIVRDGRNGELTVYQWELPNDMFLVHQSRFVEIIGQVFFVCKLCR